MTRSGIKSYSEVVVFRVSASLTPCLHLVGMFCHYIRIITFAKCFQGCRSGAVGGWMQRRGPEQIATRFTEDVGGRGETQAARQEDTGLKWRIKRDSVIDSP